MVGPAALPLLFFVLLLPESPRFLALKGRPDEALATLARLHARGDVRDLFQHSSSKIRLDWTVGERLGWAVLHVRSCLPVVRAADGEIVRLPIEHLDISQRGEWVMDLLEYDVHLRQRGVAA